MTSALTFPEGDRRAYRDLLRKIDAWFHRCREAFPGKIPCGPGCTDCCRGLFDVTPLDRDLLLEGMAGLDGTARKDIRARAAAVLAGLRASFPDLGGDLGGRSPAEIDRICQEAGDVPCPALGGDGRCRLYAHRPLLCRLEGLPLVDASGRIVHAEACRRCAVGVPEVPRLDFEALRREERRLLRRRPGPTLLIPQALSEGV